MRDLELTFLTRPGCHLCDDARPIVSKEARRIKARLEEVDIDTDDILVAVYGMRIPVVLGPGDVVLVEGVIDTGNELRRKLNNL